MGKHTLTDSEYRQFLKLEQKAKEDKDTIRELNNELREVRNKYLKLQDSIIAKPSVSDSNNEKQVVVHNIEQVTEELIVDDKENAIRLIESLVDRVHAFGRSNLQYSVPHIESIINSIGLKKVQSTSHKDTIVEYRNFEDVKNEVKTKYLEQLDKDTKDKLEDIDEIYDKYRTQKADNKSLSNRINSVLTDNNEYFKELNKYKELSDVYFEFIDNFGNILFKFTTIFNAYKSITKLREEYNKLKFKLKNTKNE